MNTALWISKNKKRRHCARRIHDHGLKNFYQQPVDSQLSNCGAPNNVICRTSIWETLGALVEKRARQFRRRKIFEDETRSDKSSVDKRKWVFAILCVHTFSRPTPCGEPNLQETTRRLKTETIIRPNDC